MNNRLQGLIQKLPSPIAAMVNRVIHSRVLKNSTVLFSSNVIATGLAVVTSVILARILGPSSYGSIVLAISIVNAVVGFIELRGNEGLVKFMAGAIAIERPAKAMAFLHLGVFSDIILGAIAFLSIWLLLPVMTAPYSDSENLKHLISLYMLTIPINFVEKSFGTVFTTFRQFEVIAGLKVTEAVVRFACLAILASQGPEAIMIGHIIVSAVGTTVTLIAAGVVIRRNFVSLRGSGYWSALREFIHMAFHLNILATIKVIVGNIDILVIGAIATASQVGYYSVANGATSLTNMTIGPVARVLYPEISDAWARKDLKRVKYLINRYMMFSVVIAGVGSIVLGLAADLLVAWFYGPDYGEVALLIRLLLIGSVISGVFGWVRATSVAAGKPQANLFPSIVTTIMRILLVVGLVAKFGAVGAALAFNIYVIVNIIASYLLVLPKLGWWERPEQPI